MVARPDAAVAVLEDDVDAEVVDEFADCVGCEGTSALPDALGVFTADANGEAGGGEMAAGDGNDAVGTCQLEVDEDVHRSKITSSSS